jgi:hypothetical protein
MKKSTNLRDLYKNHVISTYSTGRVGKKIIQKIDAEILEKYFFQNFFFVQEKENLEEYS